MTIAKELSVDSGKVVIAVFHLWSFGKGFTNNQLASIAYLKFRIG